MILRGWGTSRRRWLTVIVALALVLRVALVLATSNWSPPPSSDPHDFERFALPLAAHGQLPVSEGAARGGPTAFRPPLYPVELAAIYRVVGVGSGPERWQAARLIGAVLGAVAVALIFLIALRLWDEPVAVLAGGIAAVYPPLVMAGSSLMSEALFIPLVLGAVLAALAHRASRHRWRFALLTGLLVGLASLTRGNGIVLLVLVGLLWPGPPRLSVRAARAPLAMVLVAVITILPWTLRNANELHAFVPVTTETGFALAGTYAPDAQAQRALWRPPVAEMLQVWRNAPSANEAAVSGRLSDMAIDYVRAHPASLARTVFWNTARTLNLTGPGLERALAHLWGYPRWLAGLSVYAFWVLLPLAAIGAFTRAGRRAPLALWACPLLLLVTVVLLLGLTRYRLPADPFLVLLAALGLRSVWERRGGWQVPSSVE